jgi:four helix bundle protein
MNDLHGRLKNFAVAVYKLTLKFRKDSLLNANIDQLIRSSASPGANYGEAQSASSTKDFNNKIRISLKEMRETNYWLEYFNQILPETKELAKLIDESEQLCKILSAIAFKTRAK